MSCLYRETDTLGPLSRWTGPCASGPVDLLPPRHQLSYLCGWMVAYDSPDQCWVVGTCVCEGCGQEFAPAPGYLRPGTAFDPGIESVGQQMRALVYTAKAVGQYVGANVLDWRECCVFPPLLSRPERQNLVLHRENSNRVVSDEAINPRTAYHVYQNYRELDCHQSTRRRQFG
jgi:hypothetical protein